MIYLITNREMNICKIGFSNKPETRLSQLQTGNPYKLTLETFIEGDLNTEKELHTKFSDYRLEGEWFTFDECIQLYFNVETCYVLNNVNYWEYLENQLTPLEFKTAFKLVMLANPNDNSLPLGDYSTIPELTQVLNISKNVVKPMLNKFYNLGVYKTFEDSWVINPLISYSYGNLNPKVYEMFK